jgi:adenylate cyclase
MNEYLSAMTDIIEGHGGYVDKYIGDSIVAMFGAPADDPVHARNAVHAALKCHKKLAELNAGNPAFAGHDLSHRIGLNSGEAVVGNIGSRRRFNYTVMSDTVNVASRLEGANKYYGTAIMASETTMAQSDDTFAWRELDAIKVMGRGEAIKVFEPLAEKSAASAEQTKVSAAYAEGLACWCTREFAKASDAFERVANADPASALFARRARALAANPPPPDWTPVNTLEGK